MADRKNTKSTIDAFLALSDSEKEKIAAEFDTEFVGETFGPMPADKRKLWQTAKKKESQPLSKRGNSAVLVALESRLLKRADAYAKIHGMSRSKLIAKGLELAMSS